MHVPIGRSGVQAVPKTLHSHGRSTPRNTSPHWQAGGSATRAPGSSKPLRLGVELRPAPAQHAQRAVLDEAKPAPFEAVAELHRLVDRREGALVAVAAL